MAEQIRAVKRIEKVRGKDVEGKVRVLERTYPHQLMLFQTFIPEDDPDDKYSNTIELYDAIPKYFSNARAMDAMRKDGIYLPTLERVFQHRHETYTVQIRPARVRGRTGAEQIPPDYVVTHPCLRNPLDVSTRGAHHVSYAPRTTDREMRHGADRQTQTPKPHPHRRLSRSGYLLAAPGQWQGVHRVRASLHPLHWFPTPSQIDL